MLRPTGAKERNKKFSFSTVSVVLLLERRIPSRFGNTYRVVKVRSIRKRVWHGYLLLYIANYTIRVIILYFTAQCS